MILLILKFLTFYLKIATGCSLLNNSQVSILPQQQPTQVIEITYKDFVIKSQENVESGVWFKWQPFSHIQQIGTPSAAECQNEFIYSLETKQEKRTLFLLFIDFKEVIGSDKFKIGLRSHFFKISDYFYFDQLNFEGVWIFFYASYDIKLKIFTFICYHSELKLQQQIQVGINTPLIIDTFVHTIGGIKEKIIFEGMEDCFSQFQGRLSTVFFHNWDGSLEDCEFALKDCLQQKINLIDDVNMNGSKFFSFETPILEKNYFQLKGWFMMNYEQMVKEKQTLIRITPDFDKNLKNFENSILLQIQLFWEEQEATIFFQSFKYDLQTGVATVSKASQTAKSYFEAFKQWHFAQIEIIYSSNKARLNLFSYLIQEQTTITLDFQSYTGIINFITIGGGPQIENQYYFGNIYNLLFQSFCEQSQKDEDFTIDCHYSCLQCYGPFEDNCLLCQETDHRVFKNSQCICDLFTFDVGQSQCLDAKHLFTNIEEVEMNCQKIGFDICNDEQSQIQCSFGYFQYQNDCVKCPYFQENQNQNEDKIIQCINCLVFPENFSTQLKCNEDAVAFYFDKTNTFSRKKRDHNEIDFFEIIQSSKGQFNLQIKTTNSIQTMASFCKLGQFLNKEGHCNYCEFACEECENEIKCAKCSSGYYLTQNYNCVQCGFNCETCELKNYQVQCLTCLNQNYLTQTQQCKPCGQFCIDCNSQGYCNYCIDSQKYFISLDGINCLPCNIKNCKFCYQILNNNGMKISTFQINLINHISVPLDEMNLQIYCSKCDIGFVLNYNDNTCNNLNEYQECLFGEIINEQFTCLSDQYFLSKNNCVQFEFCEKCVLDQCVQCQDGYYLNLYFGTCHLCQENCKVCKQQNKQYKDYWKQEILPFYLFMKFKGLVSNPFSEVVNSKFISDNEAICIDCQQKYILYNKQCIKDCNNDCEQCEIINSQATCIKCKLQADRQLRSLNSNGQCMSCSKYCSACYELEIDNHQIRNQQFVLNVNNSKYLQSCYQAQTEENGFFYLNTYFKSAIKCEKYLKCYKKIIFEWNLDCENINNIDNFELQNYYYIDKFFEDGILNQMEIQQIFVYLNDLSVQEIDHNINLLASNDGICQFPKTTQFKSSFKYNIFSLQKINIKIIGKDKPILFSETFLEISDFTTIEFINLTFQSTTNIQLLNTFINQVIFTDCTLKPSLDNTELNFQLVSQNIYQLQLLNFKIKNCIIKQVSPMFMFTLNNYKTDYLIPRISIDNLLIFSSQFIHSNFIQIDGNNGIEDFYLNFQQICVQQSQFTNSTLVNSQGNYVIISQIKDLTLIDFSIQISIIFQILNVKQLIFETGFISSGEFQENSSLLLSNLFEFLNYQFNSIKISSSSLFSNNFNYISVTSLQQIQKISLLNIAITEVTYNSGYSILQLMQQQNVNFIVNITKLTITQTTYFQDDIIQSEQAIIYINCQTCILDQIEVVRDFGLPEFRIANSQNIIITNSIFTLNQELVKTILQNLFCTFAYETFYFYYFIFIEGYQKINFSNLTILSALAINHPFVLILNIDNLRTNISENINIENSNFTNNQMIISSINQQSSIIYIFSEYTSSITFKNIIFSMNYLNTFYQYLDQEIAATLFINCQFSNTQIFDSYFYQNFITNSSSSVMFIFANELIIANTYFLKSNIINFNKILSIINPNQIQVTSFQLSKIFFILSKGGCGKFHSKTIILTDILINQSLSNTGGAFYVTTMQNSQIFLNNTTFISTSALGTIKNISNGGCFYIDATYSNITFSMHNSIIEKSFSLLKGGSFYIEPSTNQNIFEFFNMTIINSFAITNSFFYLVSEVNKCNSNLKLQNILFIQKKEGLLIFFSLIEQITYDNAYTIYYDNTFIYTQFVNIYLKQCEFSSDVGLQIAVIFQAIYVELIDIILRNINSNSPIIDISTMIDVSSLVLIKNLTIDQFDSYDLKEEQKECLEVQPDGLNMFFCQNLNQGNLNQLILIDNIFEMRENQLICNLNTFSQPIEMGYGIGLIYVDISELDQFIGEQIYLTSIICKSCVSGLMCLLVEDQLSRNNIILNEMIVKNCQCGYFGCLQVLFYMMMEKFLTDFSDYNEGNRILQQNQYDKLEDQIQFQAVISNVYFTKNQAQFAGALAISGVDTLIKYSTFINNSAIIGGAICSVNSSKLYLFQTIITDNNAQIAGGLFQYKLQLQASYKLDLVLRNNNSTNSSYDLFEEPQSLVLCANSESCFEKKNYLSTKNQIIEQTIIHPYKMFFDEKMVQTLYFSSGQQIDQYSFFNTNSFENIPSNQTFRIGALNSYNQKQNKLSESSCTLAIKVINSTSQEEMPTLSANLSYYETQFNSTSGDFNLDDLIIEFNPYYEQEIVLRIFISSDAIKIPIFDKEPPYLIIDYITNYSLFVDIKTFPCQLGEYFNSTNNACYQCDATQFQYQVKLNSTICQFKDEQKINQITSSMIQLNEYYWRAYYYSSKIEQCSHLIENCLGGWISGDVSCFIGHIGALCEQCDLYNIRGDGSFSVSSPYKCGSCEQVQGNIISIFLISLWTLISILLSVNSQMLTIEKFIAAKRLRLLNIKCILKDPSTAVLIKIFTNYIQIISTLETFQLQVPEGLNQFFQVIGSPLEQMAYSLDCFLIQITDIQIIYFRIIWSFIMASIYILVCLIILIFGIILKMIKYDVTQLSSTLVYIYIFLLPNIIKAVISLASFRFISEVLWIQGNVAYRYDSSGHYLWLIWFCFPIFLIFGIIIPFVFFIGVFKNRSQLEKIETRKLWGYLYNEYKFDTYYWEIIKIILKEFIVIVLTYYDDFIAIKASLVFILIFAYSYLTTSKSPYLTGELNNLDFQSIVICAVSIILASSIYIAQQNQLQEIIWSFYIVIAILNCILFSKMVIKILFAYFQKYTENIEKTKAFILENFTAQLASVPFLLKFFQSKKAKQQRIHENFFKIKMFLIPQAKINLEQKSNFEFQICKNSDEKVKQSSF